MNFSVKIEGLDQLENATAAIREALASEIDKAVYVSAEHVATEYKQSLLDGEKTGRIYKRRSIVHQASAPGEAPASDTGRLVNSIHVLLEGAGSAIMRVATLYAMMLEAGTSKMAPRPAAVPAMEKSKAWIMDRLQDALRRGLARG
jgi:hypothetical protein